MGKYSWLKLGIGFPIACAVTVLVAAQTANYVTEQKTQKAYQEVREYLKQQQLTESIQGEGQSLAIKEELSEQDKEAMLQELAESMEYQWVEQVIENHDTLSDSAVQEIEKDIMGKVNALLKDQKGITLNGSVEAETQKRAEQGVNTATITSLQQSQERTSSALRQEMDKLQDKVTKSDNTTNTLQSAVHQLDKQVTSLNDEVFGDFKKYQEKIDKELKELKPVDTASLQSTIKSDLKTELKKELQSNLGEEDKEELQNSLKADLKKELQSSIQTNIEEGLSTLKSELKSELQTSLKKDIKSDLEKSLQASLQELEEGNIKIKSWNPQTGVLYLYIPEEE